MKKVLFYGCDSKKYSAYKTVLENFNITVLCLEDTSVTLEKAINESKETYCGTVTKPDFMIFSGMSQAEMFNLLTILRNNKLNFTGIKVYANDKNISYKVSDLFEHLKKEHELFVNLDYLNYLIDRTQYLDSDEKLNSLVEKAKQFIKLPNRTLNICLEIIHQLEDEMRNYYKKGEGKA